jgi:hypothetical protein
MKAVLLSARWAGRSRQLGLEQSAKAAGSGAELEAENAVLRDTLESLTEQLGCAQRQLKCVETVHRHGTRFSAWPIGLRELRIAHLPAPREVAGRWVRLTGAGRSTLSVSWEASEAR